MVNVRRQLVLGFAVLAILMLTAIAVALWALQSVNQAKDRISIDFVQEFEAVQRTRFQAEQLVSTSRGYLINRDPALLRSFEDSRNRLADLLAELRELQDTNGPGADEIQRRAAAYVAVIDDAMARRQQGESADALAPYFSQKAEPARAALDAALDDYVQRERASFQSDVKRANAAATRSRFVVIGTSGAALALGVFLAVVVIQRLSAQFRREQSAIAAERAALAAREEMTRFVSHDLRNPLNAILLGVGLLERMEEPSTAVIERIKSSAHQMSSLIEDVLDLARIEGGGISVHPRPIEAAGLMREVRKLFSDLAKRVGTQLVVPSGEGITLLADADRLLQVFSNLIGNALKFTPPGGRIAVTIVEEANAVRFSVVDTGPGMTPHQLSRVFERRWQAESGSRRGLGLGLFIAKTIVEAHGGRIWVESVVGRGTSFSFQVPRARAQAELPEPAHAH